MTAIVVMPLGSGGDGVPVGAASRARFPETAALPLQGVG